MQGRAAYLTFPYRKVSTTYLTLTIREVGLEDDGWYTCAAATRMDKAKHKVISMQGVVIVTALRERDWMSRRRA